MLRPFAHPVACCWELLRKVWNRSNYWANNPTFVLILVYPKYSAKMVDPFEQLFQHCGATHAHLKGFKAWVKGVFWAYEWRQYLSLGDLEQNEVFPKGKSWGSSCALTFNYGDMTCHVTKNWEWRKLANWWRIYFFRINKLAFLKQDKHT